MKDIMQMMMTGTIIEVPKKAKETPMARESIEVAIDQSNLSADMPAR